MVGIRREDKNRWERRAPLTPDHVAELARTHSVRFRVQPSALRVFPDLDYRRVEAEVDEDLGPCGTILAIKEVPLDRLLPEHAYLFFAHVAKGQPHNMPMLRRLLELRATLIDYEKIVDDKGRRLVAFGRHAGHAGMIDALWTLGQRLEREGVVTGLEEIRLAHEYSSLDEATHHVARVGERLRHTGVPDALHPLLFVFTGSGNVTRGALEIFDRLPTQRIFPEDLPSLAADRARSRHVVYGLQLSREDRHERIGGGAFDAAELARTPERYASSTRRWLPHATVVVNGAFWEPRLPRLVTREDLRALHAREQTPRLRVLADIACDVAGGIEATLRATSPGDPVYVYDPETGAEARDGATRGPTVLAVDNLPSELPGESSEHFGDALLRYVPTLDRCRWDVRFEELALPPELLRAVIVHRGALAPGYAYLERHL